MYRHLSIVVWALLALAPARSLHAHEPYRVEYTTSDGVVIIGDYWTPIDMTKRAPGVILLHMYRSDRTAFRPLVPALEEAGFAILAIDMRGHGESVKPEDRQLEKKVRDREPALFRSMNRDLFGAYRWLQQRPEVDLSRFALVGASAAHSGILRTGNLGVIKSLFSLRFVALAGLSSGVAVIALYFAVQRADVVVVSPIVSSSPLITLFLAHFFLAKLERVTPRLVAGTLLAIVGVVLVVLGNQL